MPPDSLRLFIAVDPPLEVALALLDALGALDLPARRATPPEQVHLTLRFLGDTPAREAAGIGETLAATAALVPAFRLRPVRLLGLPRGRPRLVAAVTDEPEALLDLEAALRMDFPGRDDGRNNGARPFLPHLTLCRYARGARSRAIDHPLDMPAFDVQEVRLVSSDLRPEGAVHTTLAAAPLRAARHE